MKDSSTILLPGENERRRSQVVSSTTSTTTSLSSGALPVRIRASRRRIQGSSEYPRTVVTAPPYDSFLLEHSTTTTTTKAISPYITSPQQVYDYRWHHRHVIPLDEPLIYFITPTHNNETTRPVQQQLADLTTLGQTLWLDGNVYWIVVEDTSTALNPQIRALLQRMGMPYAHVAARTKKPDPRMANHRGIDQRNRALNVVEELLTLASSSSSNSFSSLSPSEQQQQQQQQKQQQQGKETKDNFQDNNQDHNQTVLSSLLLQQGVVYFGDDDNTYDVRILNALRQTKTVGILPVGLVGNGPYERCVAREGRVYSVASGFRQDERTFPMDMAGFAFVASQLMATTTTALPQNKHNHDNTSNDKNNTDTNKDGNSHQQQLISRNLRFHWEWRGGFLETRFMEQLAHNLSELNPLADDCTKIYVWHTKSKALTNEQDLQKKKQRQRQQQQQQQQLQQQQQQQQQRQQQKLKQQQQQQQQQKQKQKQQQQKQKQQKQVNRQEQAQRHQQQEVNRQQQQAQQRLQQPQEQQRQGQQDQPSQAKQNQVLLLLQGDDDFVWNGGAGFASNSAHGPVPQFPLRFSSSSPFPPPKKDPNQTLQHDNEKEDNWDHIASRVGGVALARPRKRRRRR
ncbi:hypothetical protein ACA910_008414 [Epithemia clementina (nom. ined.)]